MKFSSVDVYVCLVLYSIWSKLGDIRIVCKSSQTRQFVLVCYRLNGLHG